MQDLPNSEKIFRTEEDEKLIDITITKRDSGTRDR